MKRLAICATLVCFAPAASAKDFPVLEPSSAWLLDYGEESCSLVRNFGPGDAITKLQISSYGGWVGQRVVIVGAAVPKTRAAFGTLSYMLLPETLERPGGATQGMAGDMPAISFPIAFVPFDPAKIDNNVTPSEWQQLTAEPDRPDPAFEATVERMRITFADGTRADLALGNMGKPLQALRTCVDDLVASWGLDPATQKALARNVTPDKSTVRRVQARYPSEMVRSGTNAYVPVRVMVGADGNPTRCVIQEAGIDEQFADATCDGLMRQYQPALDASGAPIESAFLTAVIYQVAR